MTQTASEPSRTRLTRPRVLDAAVRLADASGIESLSMRRLGDSLGVQGMALYRHVPNKDAILDGVVDAVIGEIGVPRPREDGWVREMRELALAARAVMLRHPWAPSIIVSRPDVGMATLGHIERVLAILESAGFPIDLAHHALHVLGSRVFGFTQDPFNDSANVRPDPETAAAIAKSLEATYPSVGRLALAVNHEGGLGGCDDEFEFAFGLDLILAGLERVRRAAAAGQVLFAEGAEAE